MMHKDLSAPLAAIGMALLSFETQLIMFMFLFSWSSWTVSPAGWL